MKERWSELQEDCWSKEENLLVCPNHWTKICMEGGYTARTQLTQNPGLFCTVQKKTNKVNTRAKDRFLRTPYFFLKNKILWSNVFSCTPRHCSVWTSQAIKNSNFWLQLTYFKREEYYEARRDFSPCPPSMYIAKKYWILWGPPNGHVPELMVYIMGWRSCSGSSEAGIEVDLVWRSFGTLKRPF